MHSDGVSAQTHITLTRKDLEAWKRRKAVTLHFSCMVFNKTIRTYHTVLATNYKTLKKSRYDHDTGQNNAMAIWGYKTLTRATMDKLLKLPHDRFRIHIFAAKDGVATHVYEDGLYTSL